MSNRSTKRSPRRARHKEPSDARKAMAKGIVPIRRGISPEHHDLFKEVGSKFKSEFRGAGRVYEVDSIFVTLVGLNRFDRRLLGQGPKTSSILDKVPSTKKPLDEVKLGGLGIFGSKLAFELHSTELYGEITDLEEAYNKRGFPLKEHPLADERGYIAHATIVYLYEQGREHFTDQRELERLNSLASVLGTPVTLLEVELPNFKKV